MLMDLTHFSSTRCTFEARLHVDWVAPTIAQIAFEGLVQCKAHAQDVPQALLHRHTCRFLGVVAAARRLQHRSQRLTELLAELDLLTS